MLYPVAIIGAGPTGITASIQLKRSGLTPLLLERARIGGLALNANLIENYPGFTSGITGKKLVEHFKRHLDRLNIKVTKRNVRRIELTRQGFKLVTDKGAFQSRTVIAASGTKPLLAGIPGEKGLSQDNKLFYEIKDLPPYTKKDIFTVIGGGDAAFDYALNLASRARRINVLFRSKRPKSLPLLIKRVKRKSSIKLFPNTVPISVELLDRVDKKSLTVTARSGNKITKIPGNYILIAVGREPCIEYLPDSLKRTEKTPGFFPAGDIKKGNCRQIGIAVGDGLLAAMQVIKYLDKK